MVSAPALNEDRVEYVPTGRRGFGHTSRMRVLDARHLDDRQFASALTLVQVHDRRVDPAVEPVTEPELRRLIADDRSEANRHLRFAAVDSDGRARAFGHLELETDDANRHFASAEVFGASKEPEAGRSVLHHMLQVAAADGRTTLLGWGPDDADEEAFWENAGAERRYSERISALDLSAVDAGLMQRWIERRQERAADVQLLRWVNHCPDEHLDACAACINALIPLV